MIEYVYIVEYLDYDRWLDSIWDSEEKAQKRCDKMNSETEYKRYALTKWTINTTDEEM